MAISIRRATVDDAAAIARVRIDCWRITYRGLIPNAYLDAMQLDDSTALWQRVLSAGKNTTSVFVADNDGDVIGFAGRRLVAAVADAQREHGARGLIVWVIAGNKGARAFYEQLGAALQVEQP